MILPSLVRCGKCGIMISLRSEMPIVDMANEKFASYDGNDHKAGIECPVCKEVITTEENFHFEH